MSCWFDGAVVVGGCGRHKGKMGGLAISEEIGLLDMSAKLISKYESIKVREGAGATLHGCRPRVLWGAASLIGVGGFCGWLGGGCVGGLPGALQRVQASDARLHPTARSQEGGGLPCPQLLQRALPAVSSRAAGGQAGQCCCWVEE